MVILVMENSDQQITIKVDDGSISCMLTFVYAKTSYIARRHLRDDLCRLKHFPFHWMLIGDFNVVLGAHEAKGGNLPPRISCEDFKSMSDNCD